MRRTSTGTADLLERDRECDRIGRLLEGAAAGAGGTAVVEGGAGLGKSRLVRWSIDQAAALGATALSARGGDLEREFAFGIVLQLLAPLLTRATPEARSRAFSGAAGLAASLFDTGDWRDGHPPRANQGLFHGLHWLVANLAEDEPLVLCVDDAHWADQPSLRFLRYLAARVHELPVSLVVAFRPLGLDAGPPELGALSAHPSAERVELQSLTRVAVGSLVAATVAGADERFADVLFEVTGGNPLYLQELLRAVRDGDVAPRADAVLDVARLSPRTISRHVLVRLTRLGEPARALAAALAVLGDRTPLARAAALAGLERAPAAEAADGLVAEEIVTVGPGERCAFTHPLIREVVEGDLPPVQRGRAHLRTARLLTDEGAEPEEVAAHLLTAPVADEPFVLDALVRAAERALERGAPEHALRFLRRALDEPLEPDRRAGLLVELARAETAVADPLALRHLDEALAVLANPADRGRARLTLGQALEAQGCQAEAAAVFEQAAADVAGDERLTREALAAYARAASIALVPDAFAGVEQVVTRVLDRPAGDETPGELVLVALLAAQRTFQGAPRPEVVALAHRAWAKGRLLEEEGPDGGSWSVLTGACTWNDEFGLSEEIATAALEAARRAGSVMAAATASFCLSMPLVQRGQLVEALAHSDQALAAASEGWEAYRFACAWVATAVHLLRGDVEAADSLLRPLGELDRPDSADLAYGLDARGSLRLLQGRPEEALEDHLAAGRLLAPMTDTPALIPWRSEAALAAHRLGRTDLARELVGASLERSRATGIGRVLARDLRVAGLLEGGRSGLALLEESAAVAETASVIETALSLLALGAALRRSGERVRARDPLGRALDLAARCGAARLVGLAQAELRAAGARPRRVVRSGIDALTPSELRVARMASEGMTNREIAQALFVTVHAVDKHLRAVFDKLSLTSRRELPHVLGATGRSGRAQPC